MSEIITPAEVLTLAFSDGEYLPSDSISSGDIAVATQRWIRPVVGAELLQAVAQGEYRELGESYLKPAIAYFTRLLLQPRLNASTSAMGLSVAASSTHRAADSAARQDLHSALRARAMAQREALSRYLDDHAHEIAEYDAESNILHRCRCDGGFVQIL